MANRTVTLMWMCKTQCGWRRLPAAVAKNGRVKTGYGIADGKEVHYPEGRFQIRYFEGSKSRWVNAGSNPTDALAMRDRLARKRSVIADAKVVGVEVKQEQGRKAVRPSAAKYIQRCRDVDAQVAAST